MKTATLMAVTLLALLVVSCTTVEQPAPDASTQAVSTVPEPSAVQAPLSIIVAEPTEPTGDISSVDSLSDDVDLEGLGALDQELAELEQLS